MGGDLLVIAVKRDVVNRFLVRCRSVASRSLKDPCSYMQAAGEDSGEDAGMPGNLAIEIRHYDLRFISAD